VGIASGEDGEMHQMSPGVERAVAGARQWASRLGSDAVRLAHFLLALLDEEEGRPATLIESVGLTPSAIREHLRKWLDSPAAPADTVLFAAARDWSLAYRHDPEFLTDAFLLAVLRADPAFERACAAIGLDATRLESALVRKGEPEAEPECPTASFSLPNETNDAARVLDANLNRAREAARVVEDYCRFVLNDGVLTAEVKALRHGLAAAASRVPASWLFGSRDTPGDVGTGVTAGSEYERSSAAGVAAANLKRLQESLRSLEEFGKLIGPELGRELETLRYRAYTLEGAIVGRGREWRGERLRMARVYAILTGSQSAVPLETMIAAVAEGGVGIIQLREKGLPDRELLAQARDVRRWTRRVGVLFVVNDRPDIARLADADGVHLGQDDLSVADARRIAGSDLLVGVSTHSLDQVRSAVLAGADYLGVGPVFPSTTKSFDDFPGLDFVRAAAAETSLPRFALGGITLANVAQVAAAGAGRIAVASAIAAAAEPCRAARELRAALERSGESAE
jgi:thiamine-phosphate pyrophosphorylase